jgi:uncharacterized protein (UPF0548 family)
MPAGTDPFALVADACLWGALVWAQRLEPDCPAWLRRRTWPFLLASLWLATTGPGALAAWVAAPAGALAAYLLALGLRRFLAEDTVALPPRLLAALAATGPSVAAAAWIWSRYDRSFAGFPEPLATLTTVHFSITFGVLPLAMVAIERGLAPSGIRTAGILAYVAAAPATALAFALRGSPMTPGAAEVACAAALAAAFLAWCAGLPRGAAPLALALLLPGILLGAGYSAATFMGWPYLTIPEMAVLHGTLNLAGSLLLVSRAPRLPSVGAPAPDASTPVDAGDPATARFVDRHRADLGPWSPEAFDRVRATLLGYRFYPDAVLVRRAAFEEAGRPVRVGDRIGLGLLLPGLPGLPAFLLPAVVEVMAADSGPSSARFGYRTTRRHYGRGEWIAEVRRSGDRLELAVDCHVRPTRWFVWLGLPLYRRFQLAAFRAGAETLRRAAA